jgi:hypothetical protein
MMPIGTGAMVIFLTMPSIIRAFYVADETSVA